MRPSASRRPRHTGGDDRSPRGEDGSDRGNGLFGWLGNTLGFWSGGSQPQPRASDADQDVETKGHRKRTRGHADDDGEESGDAVDVPTASAKRARAEEDGGDAEDDGLERESQHAHTSDTGEYPAVLDQNSTAQSPRVAGLGAGAPSASPLRYDWDRARRSNHTPALERSGEAPVPTHEPRPDKATAGGHEQRRSRLNPTLLHPSGASPATLTRANATGTPHMTQGPRSTDDATASASSGTAGTHHGGQHGHHQQAASAIHGYSTAVMLAAARLAGDASAAGAPSPFGLTDAAEFQRLMMDSSRSRLPPSPPLQAADDPRANQPWGNLLSLNANYPHVTLSGSKFTIGRHWRCNLQLLDPNISRLFCRLVYESGTVWVESLSKNGKLYVNDKLVMPNTKQVMRPGDEITIIASTRVQYIFEMTEPTAYAANSRAANARPTSAAAGASASGAATAVPRPAVSTRPGARRGGRPLPAVAPPAPPASDAAPKPGAQAGVVTAASDAKAPAAAGEGTADPQADEKLARNVKKSLEQISKGLTEKFQKHIITPKDVDVIFDDFPYYLHDEFRQRLVHAVYIYLKHPDYVKHTRALTTMSRGVMLVGPPGTELMQLAVVKALAAHLDVNLLVLSSDMLNLSQAISHSCAVDEPINAESSDTMAVGALRMEEVPVLGVAVAAADAVPAEATPLAPRAAESEPKDQDAPQADFAGSGNEKEEAPATPLVGAKATTSKDEIMSDAGEAEAMERSPPALARTWLDAADPVDPVIEAQRLVAEVKSKAEAELAAAEEEEAQAGTGESYAPSIEKRPDSDDDDNDAQKGEQDDAASEAIDGAGEDGEGDEEEDDSNMGEDYDDDGMDEDEDEGLPPFMDDPGDEMSDPVLKAMNKELKAFKKSYVFRKGDQVRYVGRSSGMADGALGMGRSGLGGLGESGSSWLFHHMPSSSSRHGLLSHSKAPPINAEGTVVMTFPGNTRKIGVSFKQAYPGSVPIEQHENCFFLAADELKVVGAHQSPGEVAISALFQTLVKNAPCILFLKDSDKALFSSDDRFHEFKLELSKLEKPVVVIGSSIALTSTVAAPKPAASKREKGLLQFVLMERSLFPHSSQKSAHNAPRTPLARLLPNKLIIRPPTEHALLEKWNEQIKQDTMHITFDANARRLRAVMSRNNVTLAPEDEARMAETEVLREHVLSSKAVDMLVGWAISHYLKNNLSVPALPPAPTPTLPSMTPGETAAESAAETAMDTDASPKAATPTAKTTGGESKEKDKATGVSTKAKRKVEPLTLPWDSLDFALTAYSQLRVSRKERRSPLQDVQTDNDYEKSLLSNVIPSDQIGVTFGDIGALTKVKNTLFELVILPLVRPELFTRGNLTKPLKGILLFGPPGTGKTLLAKAVAVQSGANFLNISVSSITSKWVGEGEKYAKAVFTLASKITPCVIFIDEIDSLLGRRDSQYEHEGMRKIKNEFMAMWDGLTTKANERVIVLAATNRPFDLDDAVLRRLPRRLLVDLPDVEQREQILRVLLRSETLEPDFDFTGVAKILEGYSGSDIRNLCVAAAYQPIREIIAKENMVERLQNEGLASVRAPPKVTKELGSTMDSPRPDGPLAASVHVQEHRKPPTLRELTFHDFEMAKKEVSASCSENAPSQTELRKWNETFGENTNTWKAALTYFS